MPNDNQDTGKRVFLRQGNMTYEEAIKDIRTMFVHTLKEIYGDNHPRFAGQSSLKKRMMRRGQTMPNEETETETPVEISVANLTQQREIVGHLIDIFGLPPYLTELTVTWKAGECLKVNCTSIPTPLHPRKKGWRMPIIKEDENDE